MTLPERQAGATLWFESLRLMCIAQTGLVLASPMSLLATMRRSAAGRPYFSWQRGRKGSDREESMKGLGLRE